MRDSTMKTAVAVGALTMTLASGGAAITMTSPMTEAAPCERGVLSLTSSQAALSPAAHLAPLIVPAYCA
jgi:hypothetical protein